MTNRLSSVAYPNGQQALYTYAEDNTQDRRLSEIQHLTPSGAVLDQFDYAYDGPMGRIVHWNQQQPGATVGALATTTYDLSYDAIGQLRQAVLNGDSTNLGSSVWSYDPAGNRTGIQAGSGTLSTAAVTSTNSLFSLSGGGSVQVAGTLSKWANVTVNGVAATFNGTNNTFQALVPLPTGTQTIAISATDVDGNTATNRYQLTISAGASESFAYDANGNTTTLTPSTSGATPETLEWDGADRVTAINTGTHRTQFAYDGNGARVRITELDSGNVITDHFYVANEERDALSGQVLRLFFGEGEQRFGSITISNYYYADDHLGSAREFTDDTGAVQASYSYDLWGSRTKVEGSLDTEIGFAGYWHHAPTMQEISPTRLYNAALGRFLSRDPLGEKGGQLNFIEYAGNNPSNLIDPTGLALRSASNTLAYVSITTAGSVNQGYMNTSEFVGNLMAASPGSVTHISITGHGASNVIQLSDGTFLTVVSKGVGYVISDEAGNDLTSVIQNALANTATIDLEGCHTGEYTDQPSIAEVFAEDTPLYGSVTGYPSFSFGLPAYGLFFGLPVTYSGLAPLH